MRPLGSLGLPQRIVACLFDVDGVLTDTAATHNAAWKQTFDRFLRARDGTRAVPFDSKADYETYVDGKRRADGVRDFLASRGIRLPEGSERGHPDAPTIQSLAESKNELLLRLLHEQGVHVYAGSRRYLELARDSGLRRAAVSSSANAEAMLRAGGLSELIEVRVDGLTAQRESLRGKPAPDMFSCAAQLLGAAPEQSAVFEDAVSGVTAARAGRFGFVVGVDRVGHAAALRACGADRVVADLTELLTGAA